MNAADHLGRAEHILDALRGDYQKWDQAEALALATEAVGHALVAVAIELGAPHGAPATGATAGG